MVATAGGDIEAHIDGLFDQLTRAEKASLTGGADLWHLPAIARLGIGRLTMSDGPSGVRGARFTDRSLALPCGAALGATWNPELIEQVGEVLAAEAITKGVNLLLGPTVCIPRTPLAGRTFESYAEDPYLTSRLAVAYVAGVQRHGVGCCIKHFACNDQEFERMTISAEVDAAALREIHLPAFEAGVREAGVWAVMSAYNRVNGTYCAEHPVLLGRILKEEWDFDGVVVSDWFGAHSTAPSANAGLDIEMPGPPRWLGGKLADAVDASEVEAGILDGAARRILRIMARTGLLDRGLEDVPERSEDDPARRAVARRAASESAVLLTNDGILPLDPSRLKRVALIGPAADVLEFGGGGSATVNPHRVASPVDVLRSRLGDAVEVVTEPGCRISDVCPTIDPRLFGVGADAGFRVEFFDGPDMTGTPVIVESGYRGRFLWLGDPVPGIPAERFSAVGSAVIHPRQSGRWRFSLESAGKSRLFIDDQLVVDNWEPTPGTTFMGFGSTTVEEDIELVADRPYRLAFELTSGGLRGAGLRIGALPDLPADAMELAVSAAADAEVAIVMVGSNSERETEGADRTDLDLPGDQAELVARVAGINPNTIVVINAGSPVTMPWVERVRANLMVWYPGEEGADALVDHLLGVTSPSGRLPITFPARLEDTPAFGHYPGEDGKVVYAEGTRVGYRHFDAFGIEPLFCFGHGLSYSTFRYDPPVVVAGSGDLSVEVGVTNTGDCIAAEVVQLYLRSAVRPERQLKGFSKVELAPGETGSARFALDGRAFGHWDVDAQGWATGSGDFEILVGASSRDIRHAVTVTV
jgi:beta-glucosidase